jgi:mitochondrial fission protein ELM1
MGASKGTVWILNQSVGLQAAAVEVARVVGLPIHLKRLSASGIISYFPAFVQQRLPPERLLEGLAGDKTFSAWPALIIAAGGKSSPMALAIKRLAPNPIFALKVQRRRERSPSFDLVLQKRMEEPELRLASFDAVYSVSPEDCRCLGLSDRAVSDAKLVGELIKRTFGLEL